ncbi:hypothetical protein D9M68_464520 [compost metagenome]
MSERIQDFYFPDRYAFGIPRIGEKYREQLIGYALLCIFTALAIFFYNYAPFIINVRAIHTHLPGPVR